MSFQRQKRQPYDTANADRYNGNYQSPGSPHQDFQQYFGSDRSNSPRNQAVHGNSLGYRQQPGFRNQPYQQYYSNNRNDNTSQRHFNPGQNRNWNGQQIFVNQNYDLRAQQGVNMNFPSSPTRNQQHPQFRNRFSEGSPQVYVYPGNPESGGLQRVLVTNPPLNIPVNVLPTIPPVFVNTSMALDHTYQQSFAHLATSSPMVSLQNNGIPVCTPGWVPFVPVSVCGEQPATTGLKIGNEQEVKPKQDTLLETGQMSEVPFCVGVG